MSEFKGKLPFLAYAKEENKNSRLYINCCGIYVPSKPNAETNRPFGRNDYQIIYIHKNITGHYKLNGRYEAVKEGSIVLFRPNEPQIYHYTNPQNAEIYWVHFSGSDASRLLKVAGMEKGNIFATGSSNSIRECFAPIINAINRKSIMSETEAVGCFLLLISRIAEHIKTDSRTLPVKYKKLLPALSIMNDATIVSLPVSHYARLCNLSESRFIHLFKEYTGLSPHSYFLKNKIDYSKELLLNTDYSVSKISEIINIEDPLYFSRCFKKQVGISPREYRKNNI